MGNCTSLLVDARFPFSPVGIFKRIGIGSQRTRNLYVFQGLNPPEKPREEKEFRFGSLDVTKPERVVIRIFRGNVLLTFPAAKVIDVQL